MDISLPIYFRVPCSEIDGTIEEFKNTAIHHLIRKIALRLDSMDGYPKS